MSPTTTTTAHNNCETHTKRDRKRKRPPKLLSTMRTGSWTGGFCEDRVLFKIVPILVATTILLMRNIPTSLSSSPLALASSSSSSASSYNNGFQLYTETNEAANQSSNGGTHAGGGMSCLNGLLTFELSTGFIYKPSSAETLAMMPSTLQLTDCLDYCLHNASCLAINFEMGLCVLLSSSAKQNPQNLYSSQFPVFTIYAEKKCLLQGDSQAIRQRHRCQRAWTFERVAGYEMKTRPRRRLKLANKEHCMEACLLERDFECRSANWYRHTNECTLSDQDRHSVSQSEAGDQQIKASLHDLYGPSNLTSNVRPTVPARPTPPPGLYQNYYVPTGDRLRTVGPTGGVLTTNGSTNNANESTAPVNEPPVGQQLNTLSTSGERLMVKRSGNLETIPNPSNSKFRRFRQLFNDLQRMRGQQSLQANGSVQQQQLRATSTTGTGVGGSDRAESNAPDLGGWPPSQYVVVELPANAPVDYLENNCIYEPNKLCEFRKIQNRVLKTVDSIYQDVNSLDECKQKCLNAPYRCYSFDYGDTSERVCRTSHLDQASLLSVKEPYLDVVGAITYELASCFNVSIQCRAREMVAQVSSSKMFRGKIYVKSRPSTCLNDVRESLQFELTMRYHDENCDVRATSTSQQGVFSNDIVIQHHDRIVTTQDVGLSVYCQYDLGNRSITNNVDLAIDRIDDTPIESKTQQLGGGGNPGSPESGSFSLPLTITSLATTVVKSPNVTMRITDMNGHPVASATVGDRLALFFEIKEKTSPFGIFVREIIAMDGKQLLAGSNTNNNGQKAGYHYGPNGTASLLNEKAVESMFQANKANSVQFIDSDGCPTDANIMGPLIRMDPAGHKVLAPFDAFKFPTSDMVFFRAVVTSCVSECRPVVCQSANAGPVEALNYITSSTTTTTSSTTSSTASSSGLDQHHHPSHYSPTSFGDPLDLPASRNMPSTPGQLPDLRSTTPSPGGSGFRYWSTTTVASSMGGQEQSPPARLKGPGQEVGGQLSGEQRGTTSSGSSGDSLTTIPGFGVPEQASAWQQPVATKETTNVTVATSSSNGNNNHQQTNNKKPSRPSATNLDLQNVNNNSSDNANKLGPIDLDTLSSLQRQQIVKMFETKLKQQLASFNGSNNINNNGNISEMADLYTSFLTSIMLNGAATSGGGGGQRNTNNNNNNNNNNNPEVGYKKHEMGSQTPPAHASARDSIGGDTGDRLRDFETLFGNSVMVANNNEEAMGRSATTNNSAHLVASSEQHPAKLINGLESLKQEQQTPSEHHPTLQMTKPQSILEQEVAAAGGSIATIPHESTVDIEQPLEDIVSGDVLEHYNGDLTDIPSQSGNGSQTPAQQTFDNYSAGPMRSHQQQSDLAMASSEQQFSEAKIPATATAKIKDASVAAYSDGQRHNRKRDKQQAANMQALADSYFGAYQSYGKRRRRRQVEEPTTLDSVEGSGVYILVSQPQEATYVAPSVASHTELHLLPKFTNGLIEIYRASEGPPKRNRRKKREAQPSYDMDELVVQSIKIMDRLQFQDEEATQPMGGSNSRADRANSRGGKQNLPRSQLVTRSQPGNLTRSASAFAMSVDQQAASDEAIGVNEDSSASGWSSSGALSLVIVGASFIFVQILLVLVCLVEFNHRWTAAAAASARNKRRSRDLPRRTMDRMSNFKQCNSVSTLSSQASSLCGLGGGLDNVFTSSAADNPVSPIYSTSLYNQISAVDFGGPSSDLKPAGRASGRSEIDSQLPNNKNNTSSHLWSR